MSVSLTWTRWRYAIALSMLPRPPCERPCEKRSQTYDSIMPTIIIGRWRRNCLNGRTSLGLKRELSHAPTNVFYNIGTRWPRAPLAPAMEA